VTGRPIPPSAFADDSGEAAPELEAALQAYAEDPSPGAAVPVYAALLSSRLLVGVEAVLVEADASGADKESAMALATLVGRDGRQAVPAFSSVHTLARWRPDARPVPVHGAQVLQWTVDQAYAALVVDAAGPVPFAVEGQDLDDLARGYVPVPGPAALGFAQSGSLAMRTPAPGLLDPLRQGLEAVLRADGAVNRAWAVELAEPEGGQWQLAVAVQLSATAPTGQLDSLGRELVAAARSPLLLVPVQQGLVAQVAAAGIPLRTE
jgi:hypothetical protein